MTPEERKERERWLRDHDAPSRTPQPKRAPPGHRTPAPPTNVVEDLPDHHAQMLIEAKEHEADGKRIVRLARAYQMAVRSADEIGQRTAQRELVKYLTDTASDPDVVMERYP